jgi:hypothetical protein
MYKEAPFSIYTPTFFKNALCKGAPQSWFFPEFSGNHRAMRNAKQMCSTCSVSTQCLEYGKRTGSSGIWGGLTLSEGRNRKRVSKKTNQQQKKESK